MSTNIQGKRILIIDDDTTLLLLLKQSMRLAGGHAYTAKRGAKGLQQFYVHQPDLVILDVMMPDIDGFEICRLIRQSSNVPIIILTALALDEKIVHGFKCGADDYITKPFSSDVLLARVQAILRRATLPTVIPEPVVYKDGYLTIDIEQYQVFVRGEPVKLSAKEHQLLMYLFQNAGRVQTMRQILEYIWGWEYKDSVDYIHVYIHHLRQKLEKDPKKPKYLLTEHGLGYRFEKIDFASKQLAD